MPPASADFLLGYSMASELLQSHDLFTPDECANYFTAAGYDAT